MPILQITAPCSEEKQVYQLSGQHVRIGRDQVTELRLDDQSVSREHATVYLEQDAYFIADRDSLNGVWLNGRRIDKPEILKNRDRIMIGDFELVFLS